MTAFRHADPPAASGPDAQKLLAAVRCSPVGFCLVSREGAAFEANDAACSLLGRTPDQLRAGSWRDWVHPDDLDADQILLEDMLQGTRQHHRLQRRFLRPDASVRWVDLSVTPVREDHGRVDYFVWQLIDVTDLRAVQDDLAEQNTLLQAVLDSELDPRLLVRPVRNESGVVIDLICHDVNRSGLELFGMTREQIVGASMTRAYPTMRETGLFDAYVAVLETGEPYVRDDSKLPSQSRQARVPVDLRAVRIGADLLSVTWRDLTDRYEAQDAIAASEARYRLLAENISDVVLTGDPTGHVQWISESVGPRLGIAAQEVAGRPLVDLFHADDRPAMHEVLGNVLAGQEQYLRARLLTPVPAWRWYDIVIKPVADNAGQVTGWVAGWRDAHAEQLAVEELATSRAQYQLVAENAAEVVMLCEPTGRIEWVSPSVERLLGWTRDDRSLERHWDFVHPDDREALSTSMAPLNGDADSVWATARLRNTAGVYEYWSIHVRRTSPGQQSELVITLRNTDLEVRARGEARAQTARRVAALDSMFDPHVLLRAVRSPHGEILDFEFMDANSAVFEIGLTTPDALLGARAEDVVPDLRSSGLFDKLVGLVASGEPLVLDEFMYNGDLVKRPRRFDLRGVKVGDSVSLTWRDVTDRYRMRQRLAVSEERFRLMATNTSDIIGLTDVDGVLEWVSPALQRELGWQTGQWIGHRVEDYAHPEDVAHVRSQMAEVMAGSGSVARSRLVDQQGTYHWAESRAVPFLDDTGETTGMMAAITIIDERVAQEELLRHRASHDPLTGLLTRDAAQQRLAAMLGCEVPAGRKAFLAFIDMDNMKEVNDTLGHGAGDELLRTVASRIRALLRDTDIVARFGGDELLLVMPGMEHDGAALALMRRLLEVASASHPYGEHSLHPRMSIGLSALHAGDEIDAAVHRADAAMYRAKAQGGNCVVLAAADD